MKFADFCLKKALEADRLHIALLKSALGADQARSEMYRMEAAVWRGVAAGGDLEAAIAEQDAIWRRYAANQEAKVGAAPKLNRGPTSGCSTIHYRWVDPDALLVIARSVRGLIEAGRKHCED